MMVKTVAELSKLHSQSVLPLSHVMNANATLKNLTSVQNLLLFFWLSIVASCTYTFFRRKFKLT